MPDDLYARDILAWSEHQADLLRRLARGERVNDLDWEHVVEEIEDVGRSELHAVEAHLELILVHLLKLRTWPDSDAARHWRAEVVSFQSNARRRFAPSMRQHIDLADVYGSAARQVTLLRTEDQPATWPTECPFSLDQLLAEDCLSLERDLAAASSPTSGSRR